MSSANTSPELTLAEEIAEFERLKPRLAVLWQSVFPRDDQHYTSVVVPSLTLDPGALARLPGVTCLEERLLFLLIRLRNPHARMVYVTSQPIHPKVLEYYFQLVAGIPASQAQARLTLLCAYDGSPRPLTEKILERPRLLQRIRTAIRDPARAYLSVYNSTRLERRLAVRLGIPLNGVDPELSVLGTKSGSRRLFREAGVECAPGAEDLYSRADVEEAMLELRRRRPGLRRCVLKLNDSLGGEGNAVVFCPPEPSREAMGEALQGLQLSTPAQTADGFFQALAREGGVVEELLEGREQTSPSVQLRINPLGAALVSSTHEQIMGGPTGLVFQGCRFPARDAYRLRLQDAGLRIARVLASKGVVSRVAVDFLAGRDSPGSEWSLTALEINLRMGAATHPMLALRFLTGGRLEPETGVFRTPRGDAKYYRATDNLHSEAYRRLAPEDLLDLLTVHRLHYSHHTETGALFYMIGGISEFGRVGMMAIANSPEEAEVAYERTVAVLDEEAGQGWPPSTPGRDSRVDGVS
jgi:pheganomycin biosynthesis PGM1-like protein